MKGVSKKILCETGCKKQVFGGFVEMCRTIFLVRLWRIRYNQGVGYSRKDAYKAGILIVTATGNNEKAEYPAAYEEVVAVGTVDCKGNYTGFT